MKKSKEKTIKLGYGSGGLLTSKLINDVILKYFKNKTLKKLEDSAELKLTSYNLAFTTDSYVINPIFFPGGDIGALAINGTVNDLAMKGAIPKFISFSLIIEEGLPFAELEKILDSAAHSAKSAGVQVVCGDTKVVEKGKADKIFITTSGIGVIKLNLSRDRIRPGDRVIISGTIGDHGIAIMNERLKLGLIASIKSDTAPVNLITDRLFQNNARIHFMRDPTRGGVASVLNEAVAGKDLGIMLDEINLPIKKEVRGASEILGLDPLYIANEGKFIAIVEKGSAERILKQIKKHPLGRNAAIIGRVVKKPTGVWIKTTIGGIHPLLQLEAEGLPRIC
ncbi:hydrogenase expression/formation protein HypE [candidate division WOR-3 bacterium 4484_100]|uniref:Hydrogenase expression/formation protein HypE n=1 Tax=candidate division WOR-3 bacterium 4484_100 TaxID=1936077 RepID=A0A1V4QFB4_UNCW3|nr:MAG: hydrogenase expression/formation protein HypE [candidate division WOR-3 bacterium 4484_100]